MRDTIKIAAAEAARPGITQRLGEFDATATQEPRATPSLIFKEASVVYGRDEERIQGALPHSFRALRKRYAATCEFYLADPSKEGQAQSRGMKIRGESDFQLIRDSDVIIVRDAAAKRRAQSNELEPTTYKAEYEAVRPRRPLAKVRGETDVPKAPHSLSTKHRDDFKPFKFGPFPRYDEAPHIGPNPNKTGPTTYSEEFIPHERSLKQPSVYEDDVEIPEPYEAPYVSSYGRAFVKPKKQAPRGEFKGAFPSKPSGASAFTSEYRGAYEPVKGVKAAPAPIISAKEDVPQYGDYHSTARDEMRRTFRLPGTRKVFLEPEGSLQA